MPGRALPRAMKAFFRLTAVAGRFPATAVLLGLIVMLAGCRSSSVRDEVLRIDGSDGVYARGHAISAKMIGGRLYYRMQSVLAGKEVALACRHDEATSTDGMLTVSLENCLPDQGAKLDAMSLLPSFRQAGTELEAYFPAVAAKQITVVALPFGARYYSSRRGWRKPGDLAVEFAFWWSDERDASLRNAVRSFAHEFTHLAVKAQSRKISSREEEVLASTFENCIELSVFGNLSVDPDDRGDDMLLARVGAESLRRSISGSRVANDDAGNWSPQDSVEDVRQRCRKALDSV